MQIVGRSLLIKHSEFEKVREHLYVKARTNEEFKWLVGMTEAMGYDEYEWFELAARVIWGVDEVQYCDTYMNKRDYLKKMIFNK